MNIYKTKSILSSLLKFNFIKIRIGNQKSSERVSNNQFEIPRVVFQTTRSKWLPWRFWIDVKKLRKKNCDLNFITFDQKDMKKWMSTYYADQTILKAFEESQFGVVQSDIFKYCYAYKFGGISLDLSKYLTSSLSKTLIEVPHELVLSQQTQPTQVKTLVTMLEEAELKNNLLINWCFSTVPNNAAILEVIKIIENNYNQNKGKVFKEVADGIWNMTGPVAFNLGVLGHVLKVKQLKIRIDGIDFGEKKWPKFRSSSLVNVYKKHYTEELNRVIFK
jgi:mannosyltransferase OCH1-like enzyme